MPEERIAAFVQIIEFNKTPVYWLPQFEAVLHKILRYEFYLDKVPDNLSLPRHRAVVVKTIFRMLNQASKKDFSISRRDIQQPDPKIKQVLEYIKEAELKRKEALYQRYPVTTKNIRAILAMLKNKLEI